MYFLNSGLKENQKVVNKSTHQPQFPLVPVTPDLKVCSHPVKVHQLLNNIINFSANLFSNLCFLWYREVEVRPDEFPIQYGTRRVQVKLMAGLNGVASLGVEACVGENNEVKTEKLSIHCLH